MEAERVMKRVGSLIKVRPEYEERYIILHKHTFPEVLQRIRKSGIRNYSIFLLNGILFSYYEYVGTDYDADMKAIGDPVTKEWWKLTDPMQEPLPTRKEGEWWAGMEQLLCFAQKSIPSPGAQRVGVVATVAAGKEQSVAEACAHVPPAVETATVREGFQNCNLYIKDGQLYFYYEYDGKDRNASMERLLADKAFAAFRAEIEKSLIGGEGHVWTAMKEVFHTD